MRGPLLGVRWERPVRAATELEELELELIITGKLTCIKYILSMCPVLCLVALWTASSIPHQSHLGGSLDYLHYKRGELKFREVE